MTTTGDRPEQWPVLDSAIVFDTERVVAIRTDRIVDPSGRTLVRDVVDHPGAVAVLVMDDQERVLTLRQFRHPVGHVMTEIIAGLLDIEGEDYLSAAARELAEEGQLEARDWRVLVDVLVSPGMTNESVRVFLARDLAPAAHPEGFVPLGEEAHMEVVWVPLDELVDGVLAGRLANAALVSGVLAAQTARTRGGYDTLRPADAPWPSRERIPRPTGHRLPPVAHDRS